MRLNKPHTVVIAMTYSPDSPPDPDSPTMGLMVAIVEAGDGGANAITGDELSMMAADKMLIAASMLATGSMYLTDSISDEAKDQVSDEASGSGSDDENYGQVIDAADEISHRLTNSGQENDQQTAKDQVKGHAGGRRRRNHKNYGQVMGTSKEVSLPPIPPHPSRKRVTSRAREVEFSPTPHSPLPVVPPPSPPTLLDLIRGSARLGDDRCGALTTRGQPCSRRASHSDGRCYLHTEVGRGGWFDVFWRAYPRRVGRQAAERKFALVARDRDPCEVIAAAYAYARHCEHTETETRFIAHPTTWLNQGRYLDPPADEQCEQHYRWALRRLRGDIVPDVPFSGRRELLDPESQAVLEALEKSQLEPPVTDIAAAFAQLRRNT